jgi:periplasmic protein TonB
MELRKNPKSDLKRFSGMFFNLGLVLTLTLVIMAFEWETPMSNPDVEIGERTPDELVIIPITRDDVEPPKPKKILKEIVEVEPLEEDEPEVEYTIQQDNFDISIPDIGVPDEEEKAPGYFIVVEEMPSPEDFWVYVRKNLKYPSLAKRQNISGPVFMQFTVMPDGSLSDIEVLRGIGGGCDEEALRVLKSAPKWKPGKQRGVPVPVRMNLAIRFQLQ